MQMHNFTYGAPGGYPQGGYGQGYPAGGYPPNDQYGSNPQDEMGSYYSSDQEFGSQRLSTKKSFTGPLTEQDRRTSSFRRRQSLGRRSTRNVGDTGDGLARHGSVFRANRERCTQMVPVRGVHDDEEEMEDLKQYYGDMAGRKEERVMDGLRGVRSYRGDIEEGEDMGKPRRVTERNNVHGRKATGYGGINFKRDIAMRKGEHWGDIEIRRRQGNSRPMGRRIQREITPPMPEPQFMYMPMPIMVEQPMMPMVFEQEDVKTYSNLSDAFAEGAIPDDDEEDEFS